MFETQKIDIRDLPILTDLTISEQENLTGGQYTPYIDINRRGDVRSSVGDAFYTPTGVLVDENPLDDPYPWGWG